MPGTGAAIRAGRAKVIGCHIHPRCTKKKVAMMVADVTE